MNVEGKLSTMLPGVEANVDGKMSNNVQGLSPLIVLELIYEIEAERN